MNVSLSKNQEVLDVGSLLKLIVFGSGVKTDILFTIGLPICLCEVQVGAQPTASPMSNVVSFICVVFGT